MCALCYFGIRIHSDCCRLQSVTTLVFSGPDKQNTAATKQQTHNYIMYVHFFVLFIAVVQGRCTLKDVMEEFSMNGFDSPYVPEDEHELWTPRTGNLIIVDLAVTGEYTAISWPRRSFSIFDM